jgi:hypothetical protein
MRARSTEHVVRELHSFLFATLICASVLLGACFLVLFSGLATCRMGISDVLCSLELLTTSELTADRLLYKRPKTRIYLFSSSCRKRSCRL